jgi:hypothetical protein
MPGRECYHCKQWIEEGEQHDCWTTTEATLTRYLSEELRDAWDRLRETASSFGEQRIYASHKSIMFSREACYFFVRPKRSHLELCVFLGRQVKDPQIQRIERASRSKLAHFIRVTHRDEVEPPVTDWLFEAYQSSDTLSKAAQSSRTVEHQTPERSAHSERATSGKRDGGKQLARLRRICLSIRGATEKLSHGEPTFFTPKKVFAMFANNHHGDGHIAVWLPAAEGVQTALIEEAPETYFRPPYVGASGWIGVEICKIDDQQLGALVREAFRLIDLKSTSPSRSKPVAPPGTSRRRSRKEKPGAR